MNAHQVGQLMLALAAIIALARVLGAVAKRLGQPPVVGEILAGIVVGPTLFGSTVSHALFPADIVPALSGLANVGLVLFMFIVGYELDYALVRGKGRIAASVSLGSIVLPFGLGAALGVWLAERHHATQVLPFALFLGAAMSVTAFPVLARILTDRRMHRIAVGGLALAAAAVDDVVAWSVLALVVVIASSGPDSWRVLLALPYVLLMFFAVRPLLRRVAQAQARAGRLTPGILSLILLGLLLSCYATEWLGIHVIFGAFVFGVVMPRDGAEALRHAILERLEQVSVLLLLPAFFVLSGMKVDLSTVDGGGLLELGLILLVAIGGKLVGAYLGARLNHVPPRQAGALGILMNTRGLTEIVILTVGLQLGILDQTLFSLMVVMALVTTAMAGPLLNLVFPRRRVEREIAEADRAALSQTDAYRVLVVVADPETDEALVDLGADLVGTGPAELVLTHFVPYQPRLELGGGLSGELLEVTRVMGEMERLADRARARGLTTRVLTRLSSDPARDLRDQLGIAQPNLVVHNGLSNLDGYGGRVITLRQPPSTWPAVTLRLGRTEPPPRDTMAALEVAARLAAEHGTVVLIDLAGRPTRRLAAVVDALTRQGRPVRIESGPAEPGVVVARDGDDGAHLTTRAEADLDLDEPTRWVATLPAPGFRRVSQTPDRSTHSPRRHPGRPGW